MLETFTKKEFKELVSIHFSAQLLPTTASAVIGTSPKKICIPSIIACSTIICTSSAKGGGSARSLHHKSRLLVRHLVPPDASSEPLGRLSFCQLLELARVD